MTVRGMSRKPAKARATPPVRRLPVLDSLASELDDEEEDIADVVDEERNGR